MRIMENILKRRPPPRRDSGSSALSGIKGIFMSRTPSADRPRLVDQTDFVESPKSGASSIDITRDTHVESPEETQPASAAEEELSVTAKAEDHESEYGSGIYFRHQYQYVTLAARLEVAERTHRQTQEGPPIASTVPSPISWSQLGVVTVSMKGEWEDGFAVYRAHDLFHFDATEYTLRESGDYTMGGHEGSVRSIPVAVRTTFELAKRPCTEANFASTKSVCLPTYSLADILKDDRMCTKGKFGLLQGKEMEYIVRDVDITDKVYLRGSDAASGAEVEPTVKLTIALLNPNKIQSVCYLPIKPS